MLAREAIQKRSYTIWEREGRPHGRDHEHWKLAESELLAELGRLHDEAKAFVEASAAAPKDKKAKAAQPAEPRKRATKAKSKVG